MKLGKLIVFEGIDGTGKSTQARFLAEYLQGLGQDAVLSFEPTMGVHGKKIRDSFTTARLPKDQELALFLEDRRDHVTNFIIPARESGKTVILDRYYFSNVAYQSAEGFDAQAILAENLRFAPQPDWLLLFDIPVDAALSRIHHRDGSTNSFEKKTTLESCRRTFLEFAALPYAQTIDASLTPQKLHQEIVQLFLEKFSPESI